MLRTNYYLPGPKPYLSFKLDSDAGAAAAAAAAALRDLRVLAAGRGRAPARRVGRPRRPALVGPARGLPHRDPRPDEGADGQERADRAGRGEGRIRGQAPGRRGRRVLHDVHQRAARHHRQHRRVATSSRPSTSCATTATTRTWWSPPTRARRRSRDIANGVADRLRLLARRRVRLRRVGRLRPQGDGDHRARRRGSRCSATSASWGSTSKSEDFTVVGIGDMSGDVFGNGMLLSPHIRLLAAFDHRHIFLDPDPDPAASIRRARAPVRAGAVVVGGLRRVADLRGRRRLPAHGEVDPALAAGAGGARTSRLGS